MRGYVAILLHGHLPFVRHPEHERFLEESWLYEAITECYLPLVQVARRWQEEGVPARLTLTLSPTLCAMLGDALLRRRYEQRLDSLLELARHERFRTRWEPGCRELSEFYARRLEELRDTWAACEGNLIPAFRDLQDAGILEIITTAATHGLLPLLRDHPGSVRGQIRTACQDYRRCFGQDPRGFWLPECAYYPGLDAELVAAGLRWFVVESHGVTHSRPRPRFGTLAPVYTPHGLAAFGRDLESAQQVWSRQAGYPGDPRYRDFYRDIGFDLEFEYVRPVLPAPDLRGFTGIKYHRIGRTSAGDKEWYVRADAIKAAEEHASHFLSARVEQVRRVGGLMDRPPLLLCPYDAELFGHWWFEGPEFLDRWVRLTTASREADIELITPSGYLEANPTQQVAQPAESSWGEEGYFRVWLNETNEWIMPHLDVAMQRMAGLAARFDDPSPLVRRALNQAARELLLAQSSDWPFIMRTGTSPDYARDRVTAHLLRFIELHDQLTATGLDERRLADLERVDNLFPEIDFRDWR